MFTVKKLESLAPKTRLRKIVILLQKAEEELNRGFELDLSLFSAIADSQKIQTDLSSPLQKKLSLVNLSLPSVHTDRQYIHRALNNLRHAILATLGAEPAEWDLLCRDGSALQEEGREVLPIKCYLEDIRSPFNVGSIFRTAEAFGVSEIYLSPDTPLPTHRRALKSARGCNSIIPWRVEELSILEKEENVFALETGGIPFEEFTFPLRGAVLIGSEELGLSPEALTLASQKAGRVSIDMSGAKRSLNVSVAFGILMREWYSRITSKRKT